VQALPVSVAFANILYGAAIYKPYLPQLSRLIIGSNAIQQLIVTWLSSLHFTVGQVQDIGLIFVNAMTKDIAERMEGQPVERVVGTAIMSSCLTTALLGLCLVLVGKCVSRRSSVYKKTTSLELLAPARFLLCPCPWDATSSVRIQVLTHFQTMHA
jgi:hypothetical protein